MPHRLSAVHRYGLLVFLFLLLSAWCSSPAEGRIREKGWKRRQDGLSLTEEEVVFERKYGHKLLSPRAVMEGSSAGIGQTGPKGWYVSSGRAHLPFSAYVYFDHRRRQVNLTMRVLGELHGCPPERYSYDSPTGLLTLEAAVGPHDHSCLSSAMREWGVVPLAQYHKWKKTVELSVNGKTIKLLSLKEKRKENKRMKRSRRARWEKVHACCSRCEGRLPNSTPKQKKKKKKMEKGDRLKAAQCCLGCATGKQM